MARRLWKHGEHWTRRSVNLVNKLKVSVTCSTSTLTSRATCGHSKSIVVVIMVSCMIIVKKYYKLTDLLV